jgi:hypothetical protein
MKSISNKIIYSFLLIWIFPIFGEKIDIYRVSAPDIHDPASMTTYELFLTENTLNELKNNFNLASARTRYSNDREEIIIEKDDKNIYSSLVDINDEEAARLMGSILETTVLDSRYYRKLLSPVTQTTKEE